MLCVVQGRLGAEGIRGLMDDSEIPDVNVKTTDFMQYSRRESCFKYCLDNEELLLGYIYLFTHLRVIQQIFDRSQQRVSHLIVTHTLPTCCF